MDLKTYLRGLPDKLARDAFAKQCGVSFGHLLNVGYGKTCAGELAVAIEHATDGAVRCETLRPDIPWGVLRHGRPKRAKGATTAPAGAARKPARQG